MLEVDAMGMKGIVLAGGAAEMPMPVWRPRYSVLATERIRARGIASRPWRAGLAQVIADELAP